MGKLSILQKLGPGLLYAGAAIGVSHLVQSTRAGASFGIGMIAVVVIANFFKYPFFQIGPRYVVATGKSLLFGYHKLGKWAIWTFVLLTISTMFIVQGAITMVTAGLASYVFGSSFDINIWVFIILAFSSALLYTGKIKYLDYLMKIVMVVLAITTIAAAISSIFSNIPHEGHSPPFDVFNKEHIFFLIALIGWMPAPIDISVWYSVWAQTKLQESHEKSSLKDSMFDFSVGYWGTAILAICFVLLGAFMLHNTGIELSSSAVVFAGQIIKAYTTSLGTWATPIISVAALTTMLSTTVSVLDGVSRVMDKSTTYILDNKFSSEKGNISYRIWLLILISGTLTLVYSLSNNMRQMVDFATTISFLTAPILAYLNIRVMYHSDIPKELLPSKFTTYVSYIGFGLLLLFSLIFVYFKFLT